MNTGSGFAAWATCQSDEEAVAIAKALAELEGRRAEVAALKETLAAKDKHIAALEGLVADQAKLIDLWRTAATERHAANDADARIEASYQESVKRYEAELERVRKERDSARRSRWLYALGGVVLGAALVVAAGRN